MQNTPPPELSLEDVRAAAARIAGAVERTPFLESKTLSRILDCRLFLKYENEQFTAAFKERGALNRLLTLGEAERRRGVIAMSAGNHAQGVAWHAARLGVRAVIVMPRGTPNAKVKATAVLGAEVVLAGDTLAGAAVAARERAAREGLAFVHPYDDREVIAGQGTVALEMLADRPTLQTLVVPVGGGGLIAGMATAARALRPDIEVLGVEPERWCAMRQRLAGIPVEVGGDTLAEGLAVRDVGELPLAVCRRLVDDMLTVSEDAIERAIALLIELEKTVAEGAGAAGLAALLEHRTRFTGREVGVVLCGGNIDSRVLAAVLMRNLVRDGRLMRLRVDLPDIAGSLARVATLIGEAGGNIVEVEHQRIFGTTSARTPAVEFVVECRDRGHADELLAALAAAGLQARRVE